MYCKAITIRLLVGRLTPAMRAKSATPCSSQTVADPEGPGRYLSVRMSPEKGHKRKKPTAAMPFAARHRCSSPTGYFRLINGFQAVSSTSTRYFPRPADRNPLADPAAMLVSLFSDFIPTPNPHLLKDRPAHFFFEPQRPARPDLRSMPRGIGLWPL